MGIILPTKKVYSRIREYRNLIIGFVLLGFITLLPQWFPVMHTGIAYG